MLRFVWPDAVDPRTAPVLIVREPVPPDPVLSCDLMLTLPVAPVPSASPVVIKIVAELEEPVTVFPWNPT